MVLPSFTLSLALVIRRIFHILKKDFLLEWRQKYSIYGLILYLISSVMAINMMQEKPEGETWNAFFWLILLFVSVNAVAKSFLQEHRNRFIYYYSVHHPREIILAKLIYNIVLMLFMSSISLLLFLLVLGNPTMHVWHFIAMVLLGGVSLSMLFTLLSAIAGMAGGNSALIAILGFPLVIPQLILLSDLSKPLIETRMVEGWWSFFAILIALDVLLIILSVILFPFLWKE